jgi:hypothetical protein
LRQEEVEFEGSLDNIARPCLQKLNKRGGEGRGRGTGGRRGRKKERERARKKGYGYIHFWWHGKLWFVLS